MGCKTSKPIDSSIADDSRQSELSSSFPNSQRGDDSTMQFSQNSTAWKIMMSQKEALLLYNMELSADGNPEHLEFRTLLDDIVACDFLSKFATGLGLQKLMHCWHDIQKFRNTTDLSALNTIGSFIYDTYVRDTEVLEENGELNDCVKTGVFDRRECFDFLSKRCFIALYEEVYLQFKEYPEYLEMIEVMKASYNNVNVDDFQYSNVLGRGTFGIVIKCHKKSTGKQYAMKIQTKEGLLRFFKSNPWRANLEMDVYSTFDHPFIVNLLYSFQTEKLVMLVLTLGTSGDLCDVLLASENGKLSLVQARFYGAELASAIMYLHKRGLVHRDIKPKNVLFSEDGHILLTDFGAVADLKGDTMIQTQQRDIRVGNNGLHMETVRDRKSSLSSVLFAGAALGETAVHSTCTDNITSTHSKDSFNTGDEDVAPELPRAKSFVGTTMYMAPEVITTLIVSRERRAAYKKKKKDMEAKGEDICNLGEEQDDCDGYSKAVDWWSFGITLYRMLTGLKYVLEEDVNKVILHDQPSENLIRRLYEECQFKCKKALVSQHMKGDAVDFLMKLLSFDPLTRIGSSNDGNNHVKKHIFFKSIHWKDLEAKKINCPIPVTEKNGRRRGSNSSVASPIALNASNLNGGTKPVPVPLKNSKVAIGGSNSSLNGGTKPVPVPLKNSKVAIGGSNSSLNGGTKPVPVPLKNSKVAIGGSNSSLRSNSRKNSKKRKKIQKNAKSEMFADESGMFASFRRFISNLFSDLELVPKATQAFVGAVMPKNEVDEENYYGFHDRMVALGKQEWLTANSSIALATSPSGIGKLDKQVSIAALTTPDYATPMDELAASGCADVDEHSKNNVDYFQFWDYVAPNIIIEEYRQQLQFNKI